jgi:hypothetical protein
MLSYSILIIEALDRLENVESGFRSKALDANRLITIGLSKHLFTAWEVYCYLSSIILISVFMKMKHRFSRYKKDRLAIVTSKYDTFKQVQKKAEMRIIVGSTNINYCTLRHKLEIIIDEIEKLVK